MCHVNNLASLDIFPLSPLTGHINKPAAYCVQFVFVHFICAMFLGEAFRHGVKVFVHVSILTFVISGILGEVDLAAQHVMVEVGAITYMVWIIQCVHGNIYVHIVI